MRSGEDEFPSGSGEHPATAGAGEHPGVRAAGERPLVHWTEGGQELSARWRSERGAPPPKRVVVADDRMTADAAYGLACQGTALLWRGDFHNARQLLAALKSRAERHAGKASRPGKSSTQAGVATRAATEAAVSTASAAASATAATPRSPAEFFHLERQARSQRTRTLGMLVVQLDGDYGIALRRAPDVRQACTEAWGPGEGATVVALRELLGVIGAHEWRVNGIDIPATGGRIHPHYGVFPPTRREYVDLVARAPVPPAVSAHGLAFDVGTGTGVLAAVLARRGIRRVVATDRDPRALACARENVARLGLARQVEVVEADLFPEGRAALVVCNPPWVPARPASALENGIYDPDSRMLRGFLSGLAVHLAPDGEGWLILSDLAEHLGLRTRAELLAAFDTAGVKLLDRLDVRPVHSRVSDRSDPLHAARAAEVTSLWRLAVK
jgi:SAM-dependent methyltransferase